MKVNLPSEPYCRDRITCRRHREQLLVKGDMGGGLNDDDNDDDVHLVIRIFDFHKHPQTLSGRHVLFSLFIVQLSPVVSCREQRREEGKGGRKEGKG